MKILLLTLLSAIICSGCGSTQKGNNGAATSQTEPGQTVPASEDVVVVQQMNGTRIQVVGSGNMWVSYTETIDGYTILPNEDNLYEYAVQGKKGDLKPGGRLAHDPDKRDAKEEKYIKRLTPHLRYKSPKLDELLERKNEFEND
ncbi:MAG: hypothetical protein WD077_00755 [Bacteroidia bacterium]